jgi:hypothetical protein
MQKSFTDEKIQDVFSLFDPKEIRRGWKNVSTMYFLFLNQPLSPPNIITVPITTLNKDD